MTKALEKEIEELEKQEAEELIVEEPEENPVEEDIKQEETLEEDHQEEEFEGQTERSPEEIQKAKDDYKKRREQRLAQQQQAKDPAPVRQDEQQMMRQFIYEQQVERAIEQAGRELRVHEKDFVEAYPDYQSKVDEAMEFTKIRLVNQGMSEYEATKYLDREKILLADRAAAEGKDPVEAVYNEANAILEVLEQFAEKRGYVKPKKKTNLQAIREATKPNAMTGGTGRGATASKVDFEELDDLEEIGNVTLGEMLRR